MLVLWVVGCVSACLCARSKNRFPTPLDATTKDDVYVGRIRRDISRKDNKGLELFVCGDQIKKGEQGEDRHHSMWTLSTATDSDRQHPTHDAPGGGWSYDCTGTVLLWSASKLCWQG